MASVENVFRDVPGSVMDDSGRSVFPFFIEGDSFLLSLFADAALDGTHSGQVLPFIYLLEKQLLRLTEGHREIVVVFFDDIGTFFSKSSYLSFLRQLTIAYIRRSLNTTVYTVPTCDDAYFNFQRNISPLFHIVGNGYLTQEQARRVSTIADFSDSTSIIDLSGLSAKLSEAIAFLATREVRVIRLAEINSGGGMLTGLIVSPSQTQRVESTSVVFSPTVRPLVAGDVTVGSFEAAEKKLIEIFSSKKISFVPSARVVLAVATAATFVTNSKNELRAAFAALFIAHALLLEDLPLDARAQPTELIESGSVGAKQTQGLIAAVKEMYTSLSYFAYQASNVADEQDEGVLFSEKSTKVEAAIKPTIDVLSETMASRALAGLRDIIDGRMLHRLLTLQLEGSLENLLSSDILTAALEAVSTISNTNVSVSSVTSLGSPLKNSPHSVSSKPSVFVEFSASKALRDTDANATPAAEMLAAWKVLPEADPLLVRVLLSATGQTDIDSIVSASNMLGMTPVVPDTKPAKPEDDEWDAEEATPEAEKAEEADDWEEEADDWEAEADDWEAEAEEDVTAAAAEIASSTSSIPESTTDDISLLGGPLRVNPLEETLNYWDSDKPLPDGASMKVGAQEQQVEVNPVRLRPATKIMFRKFLEQHRTSKNGLLAYNTPKEQDIRDRVKLVARELTFEKAQQWIKAAIEIRVRKFENQAIVRAESTKEHYVQSMNTPSKIILRDIVETGVPDTIEEEASSTSSPTSKNPKGNTKTNSKNIKAKANANKEESIKDKAARETNERLALQAFTEIERFINVSLKQSRLSLEKKIEKLDDKLISSSDVPSTFYGLMELLRMRVQLWKERTENKGRGASDSTSAYDAALDTQMEAAVRLLQLLNDLARRFIGVMKKNDLEEIQRAYAMLGFNDSAVELGSMWAAANGEVDDNDGFLEKNASLFGGRLTIERRFAVGMSRARFILQHAGHTLLRNVYSARDPRVSGFYPDKWQRKLLDIVDSNESSLVVAPTSAGKTLVSFYTVDKIARENKELKAGSARGVVIFIAPTFALARQMESDIMMRSKASVHLHDSNYKLTAGMNFDVLITVPSCMENLLLSPERATWLSRVRYVVFDEVHSIGSTLTGPTWERIFMLIHQAPFLALSATVGGANRFHDWLQYMRSSYTPAPTSTASKKSIVVAGLTMNAEKFPKPIVHSVSTTIRWSHLHHYFYVPPVSFMNEAGREVLGSGVSIINDENKAGLSESSGQFVPIHPCGTLAFEKPETRSDVSLLANVEFSTADTLKLYDTMLSVAENSPRFASATATPGKEPKLITLLDTLHGRLNPDNYFGFFVEKVHTLNYEIELKNQLQLWHEAVLDTEILEVVDTLGGSFKRILEPLTLATRARRQMWINQTLPMIRELMQRDWFPAIIFCLDRSLCTELAEHLVAQLEKEENEAWTKEGDKRANMELFIEERERQVKAYRKMQERKSKIKGNAELAKEEEEFERMGMGSVDMNGPEPKLIDPLVWNAVKPDERFTFIQEHELMNAKDLDYWSSRANKRNRGHLNGQHPRIKALFRGFGVHHSGVEKVYRDLVEVMFRGRNLKFVIATEGLGLGVNMPCRTTVFAFTAAELNPLNYRQMSGRAGRRGFDDKGQVVFYGIDPRTSCRLMTSSLSDLRGHFALTPDAILRVVLKYYSLREKTVNLNAKTTSNNALLDLENFIVRTFYAFGESSPQSVRVASAHHVRFCLTYFQHLQLFKKTCPTGLAYLLSVISNNIATGVGASHGSAHSGAFVFGYLLRQGIIDKMCAPFEKDPEGTARNLMALLCRLFYPILLRSGAVREDFPASTTSVFVLPEVESFAPEAAQAIKEHNDFVLRLFSRYAAATAITSVTKDSAYALPLTSSTFKTGENNVSATPALTTAITASAIPTTVRSPFFSLSGRADEFSSVSELASVVRDDVHFTSDQLPLDLSTLREGATLSAYALDYYNTGDYDEIIAGHGIDKTAAWQTLHNFRRLLQVLKAFTYKLSQEEGNDEDSGAEDSDDDDSQIITAFDKRNVGQANQVIRYHALPASSQLTTRVLKHIFDKFDKLVNSIERATAAAV